MIESLTSEGAIRIKEAYGGNRAILAYVSWFDGSVVEISATHDELGDIASAIEAYLYDKEVGVYDDD